MCLVLFSKVIKMFRGGFLLLGIGVDFLVKFFVVFFDYDFLVMFVNIEVVEEELVF